MAEGIKAAVVFENFTAAMLNAMGCAISGNPLLPGEKGWAGRVLQDMFLDNMPTFVRIFLLPGWNKRYQGYKTMIVACAGEVDLYRAKEKSEFYEVGCLVC